MAPRTARSLKMMKAKFEEAGVGVVTYSGSTTEAAKSKVVHRFQADPDGHDFLRIERLH